MKKKKKKRKKYRLNARFYCLLFILFISMVIGSYVKDGLTPNRIPNFHGWTATEAMKYDETHENISIIYELDYSYDVMQNCVMEQSIVPRTKVGNDPLILTLRVSKGLPIMENFVGKSLKELKDFAALYDLKVDALVEAGTIETQSILAGELLTKGATVVVTTKEEGQAIELNEAGGEEDVN